MSFELAPRAPTGRNYTPEEVELGLTVAAIHNGSVRRASKALELQGIRIPHATLRDWIIGSHAERYLEIRAEKAPFLEKRTAALAWENVQRSAEVVAKAIEKADEQLEDPKTDAASTAYKISLTQGIQQDKALLIEGRPSVITANVDIEDMLTSLNDMIPGLVIDSTAEEVSE